MDTCKLCSQELKIELDDDSFDEATSSAVGVSHSAPDDLLLTCGCHYHWFVMISFVAYLSCSVFILIAFYFKSFV